MLRLRLGGTLYYIIRIRKPQNSFGNFTSPPYYPKHPKPSVLGLGPRAWCEEEEEDLGFISASGLSLHPEPQKPCQRALSVSDVVY